MLLNVKSRILLLGALPTEGNLVTLKQVRALRQSLEFSDDEVKKFELAFDGKSYRWANDEDTDVQISIEGANLARDTIKKLNDEKKLTEDWLVICEKFEVA